MQRDRAFAILPYYTRWAAAQMPRTAEDPNNDPQLPDTVERLWTELYQLSQMLEKTRPQSPDHHTWSRREKDPGRPGRAGGPNVGSARESLQYLLCPLAPLQRPFRSRTTFREALVLPQIEPGIRMQLISKARSVSRQLVLSTRDAGTLLLDVPCHRADSTRRAGSL